MTSTSRTVEQTNHRLVCEALRESVRVGPGALGWVGSMRYRASAVLYLLLLEHPIDGRGRCRSCPGVLIGLRSRPCQIHRWASEWLLCHSDEMLRSHVARELGTSRVPWRGATSTPPRSGLTVKARPDPGDIDVPPQGAGASRPDPAQTPAVPCPLPVHERREAGRPDPTPGGAGDDPDGLRFRRVPPSSPGRSLVITGGMPWPR